MRLTISFLLIPILGASLLAQQGLSNAGDISALRARADAGDVKAQVAIARAYDDGAGLTESPSQAFTWFMKAAQTGDAEAQTAVGLMYRLGRGVDKDYLKSAEWYTRAAQQGSASALFNLGTLYYNGDGVGINDIEAFAFFSAARQAGNKPAIAAVDRMTSELSPSRLLQAKLTLAKMAAKGDRMPLSASLATAILEEVGNNAESATHVVIAVIYLGGGAMKPDVSVVERHCSAAAAKNYVPALVCMGYLNESGALGAGRDKEAFGWYEKAAKKGSPIAAYSLGEMYARGAGTAQNLSRAYMYLALAAYCRVELAGPLAAKVSAKLSESERKKWAAKARDENDKKIFHFVDNEDREFPFAFKADLPN